MAILIQPPGPLNLVMDEIVELRTATTQTFTLACYDYFKEYQPQGIAVFPNTNPTTAVDNKNGTWTFGRPTAGTNTVYNVQGSAPGYMSLVNILRLMAQDTVILGSSGLTVQVSDVATYVAFAFTHVGTLTAWLDGGAHGDPGSSPWVVSKNAAGGASQVANLKDTGADGTSVPFIYTVKPQVAASGGSTGGTGTNNGYGFATLAEFNAFKAEVEAIRTAVIGLGGLS